MIRPPHRHIRVCAAIALLAASIFSPWAIDTARACPFCTAQALTMTEEIDTSVVSVLANQAVSTGILRPAEPREAEGWPMEDTEDINQFFMNSTMMPVKAIIANAENPQPTQTAPNETDTI